MLSEGGVRPWQFWIDRGGTFTDIIAYRDDGQLSTHKLLSENPEQYPDAALQGIRDILGVDQQFPLPLERISSVKMGTTVATNALLEHKGDKTALVISRGFADVLRIGYQTRPDLFALHIKQAKMLYDTVVEIDERIAFDGHIIKRPDLDEVRSSLLTVYQTGIRAIAIVFMHAYRYGEHEQQVMAIAREIGFTQVSASHEVSPLMKLVPRGDTTVIDAYLSPVLHRYVCQLRAELEGVKLMFMQSNGGLCDADCFQGKDAILSGPAGGVVGMVKTAVAAGFEKLIGFDMGGTSTDVSHYGGDYERVFQAEIAGVRLCTPMMQIHTVASGGGSILSYDGARFRVGPESAGAMPGPACYQNGGPLTVTDCNVLLGKIQPDYFPQVFGPNGDQPLDRDIVKEKFEEMARVYNLSGDDSRTVEDIAEGFLAIAVDNMSNAIKQISIQRGHDISHHALCCFGGAGAQHACLVADALDMKEIYIHPFAGVLSAFGIGLADTRVMMEKAIERPLLLDDIESLVVAFDVLIKAGMDKMRTQGFMPDDVVLIQGLHCRYEGSDTRLHIHWSDFERMVDDFHATHEQQFGLKDLGKSIIIDALQIELLNETAVPDIAAYNNPTLSDDVSEPIVLSHREVTMAGERRLTPIYNRAQLGLASLITGPAIIIEPNSTIVVEPGWQARVLSDEAIALKRIEVLAHALIHGTKVDPVMLEIFNNLVMSIAQQMGVVLENTASSVNIKERLDFSCAIFDQRGELIANAPHIPVHLGSMSDCVKSVINHFQGAMSAGDVYVNNTPYNGGTHLPDITVIRPVFDKISGAVVFYVAARGHHADIGGATPGSMPPFSHHVDEEGVLIDNLKLVDAGVFQEQMITDYLLKVDYPVRNIKQNIADLKAQIAACARGVIETEKMIDRYGLATIQAYVNHVQDYAEFCVKELLAKLNDGHYCYPMDDGSQVCVAVTIDKEKATAVIDFSGTSPQHSGNFNAPNAVCKAAVLYVFRCLVNADIPLNSGFLRPLKLVIPENCMLDPHYPAAVVAGNVETSQVIVDTLFAAFGSVAASQGTSNNFTFGNDRFQYYETLCGGAGAGQGFDGADAVHTHMTNSRLTDPEILEWRFPVMVKSFHIRKGSGGQGHHKGGDGVVRCIQFNEKMSAAILSNHRQCAPFGMYGGESGKVGVNRVVRQDGRQEALGACALVEMEPGDCFVIETPGGGGYGVEP